MSNSGQYLRMERQFEAPIDTVWAMWTEPDLFAQWYGPNGASVPMAEMDVVAGGTRRIAMAMQRPDGEMRMYFTGEYVEVCAPTRLVYTESMCDADGQLIAPQSMGMPEGTPQFTQVTVELSEADGITTMTMEHEGVPAGSPGEGGWNQAFEKLAQQLTG